MLKNCDKSPKSERLNIITKCDLVGIINNTSSQRSILSWAVPRPVVQRPIPAP